MNSSPWPSLLCSAPSYQVPLAKVGLFEWETPFAQGPKEEEVVGMSQIGTFSCANPRRGLMLSQAQGPAMSAPCMFFHDVQTSSRLLCGPQGWDQSPVTNYWPLSPGRPQRRPNQFLSLNQAYANLLLLLRALVTACGCDGHRVQVLFLLP